MSGKYNRDYQGYFEFNESSVFCAIFGEDQIEEIGKIVECIGIKVADFSKETIKEIFKLNPNIKSLSSWELVRFARTENGCEYWSDIKSEYTDDELYDEYHCFEIEDYFMADIKETHKGCGMIELY